ncbi:MAG: radical SAM protein, partial [Planctomycetes bacterium]|nr:radical SAM protein [Planctomycetota bacterium]
PRAEGEERNEPVKVIRVAQELAILRGVSEDDIARVTTRNAYEFLGFNARELEKEAERVAYPIRNSLYINPTNACNNNCGFCARNRGYVVKGHDIRLDHDPSAEEMLAAMGDFSKYDEIVFCGFGEPTLRLKEILKVAKAVKESGHKVRLNTNGLGNLEYGRDITEDIRGLIDTVSVSLNTADPEQYEKLCNPRFGEKAYAGLCEFVKSCVARGIRTICTVVDMPEIDVEAARARAVELGAEFRVRSFTDAG